MINLLWSGLNVALLLSFFYVFLRAVQLLKQHIGLGPALFFVFCSLTIGCAKSNKQSPASKADNLLSDTLKNAPLGNGSALKHIPLGGSNELILLAEYYEDSGRVKPRGLYATVSGFMLGHDWQPIAGSLRQQGQQLHYTTIMHHTWSLLGLQVNSNTAQFEGEMAIPEAQR